MTLASESETDCDRSHLRVASRVLGLTQSTLNAMEDTATLLGLKFNPVKCTSLTFINGKSVTDNPLKIGDAEIRPFAGNEQEDYLGKPLGARLTFRPITSLLQNLIKVADSGLAPWQKLEVYRSCLLPSLSHHLASRRVKKGAVFELDVACRDCLRRIANVTISSNMVFFYADRRVGGLEMLPLTEEADVWTLARAMPTSLGYGRREVQFPIPINEYLAGSMDKEAEALDNSVSINRSIDSTGMRPYIVVTSTNPAIIIDVTVPLSCLEDLASARDKKIEKYKHLGSVIPLVVGSPGYWLPSNDAISLTLSIPGKRWKNQKRKMKLLTIQGTTTIIGKHLAYQTEESVPMPE
ncbi:Uncharacterized protein APZ42_013857 [Daphnia magna]|uniref:Uncharacterized protein n=1 Tax=Daphnia magna TaxID=35525 RepID=A0A162QGZ7_9CRUS|nr:Uncharacterized protein APZ42_013857 [Daphnia magna]